MKKIAIAVACMTFAALAQASVCWSWWLENQSERPDFAFGLASQCKTVDAMELSLLYGASPVTSGFQCSLFGLNNSDATCALQLAWINRGKDPCVQLGLANINKSSTFDMGFANVSDNAKFQLGFLNFNKKGFLPVCIIVNFDPDIFK